MLRMLIRPDGRKWDLLIVCVLPEQTELIFRVREASSGEPYELSEIVEKAKLKAGCQIIKASGERWPPFYAESYDRIIRDDAELEERWEQIFDSPTTLEMPQDPDEYEGLWVADAPSEE